MEGTLRTEQHLANLTKQLLNPSTSTTSTKTVSSTRRPPRRGAVF